MSRRIVVVDDVEAVREALQLVLKELFGTAAGSGELQVDTADGAASAVELCARTRPDLVLMDVNMPDVDGIAAFYELQRRAPELGRRVLFLTGLVGGSEVSERLRQALADGAAGVLVKPVTAEALHRTIAKRFPELEPAG